VTVRSVYYEKFELSKDEKAGYMLSLGGKAPSFAAVHAQVKAYRAEPKFRSVEVVDPQLEERTGGVTFGVTLALSPEVLKYVPPAALAAPVFESLPIIPEDAASAP
jgi:hypothetical protein